MCGPNPAPQAPSCSRGCRSPSIDANPTGPTLANVAIRPPANGPWAKFGLLLCPVGGGPSSNPAKCAAATCYPGRPCKVDGLTPDTTYAVTLVAQRADGSRSPPSNEAVVTMPSVTPQLTSAQAYGPTTGKATATGAKGVTYARFIFTATPKSGGAAIRAVSPVPEARWKGSLAPSTEYAVTCVGVLPGGTLTPASNALPMATPSTG